MSAAEKKQICVKEDCTRPAQRICCPHIVAGEVEQPSITSKTAFCQSCEKLKPGDDWGGLCQLCLDRAERAGDPKSNLKENRAEKAEIQARIEKEQARLREIEEREKESARQDMLDEGEAQLNDARELIEILVVGAAAKKLFAGRKRQAYIKGELDPDYPLSFGTAKFEAVRNKDNPKDERLADLIKEGLYDPDVPLDKVYKKLANHSILFAESEEPGDEKG